MPSQQTITKSAYLQILFYIFVTTGLSQNEVTFHPVDFRVKEYRFNKSSIFSEAKSIDNFTLNEGTKLIIEIMDKEGYKASFNKKDLKYYLKTQKDKFKYSFGRSKITITAKENVCIIDLWKIFSSDKPHLFIKKPSVGKNIEISIYEQKKKADPDIRSKWIIPIADYSMDLIHKPILNDNTKDFIFCTLKGFNKSVGYVDAGDTIKINMGTDKFINVSNQHYKKMYQIGNEVIIPIDKKKKINHLTIPFYGSFADSSVGEFITQIELVTRSWSYKFDNKNNSKISVGSLSYDIILPAAAVPNRLFETEVIIRIVNGEQKIFRAGETLIISINKENRNRISFPSSSLCDIDKGEITENRDGEISFKLIDDLIPSEEIYISALKIAVDQISGTIPDISDAIQLKMPSIQGTPNMILKNTILNADAKLEQYQYSEYIEIKVDRLSQIKISSSKKEGKKINIIHNSDKYTYKAKNIFPLFSKSVTTLDLKLTNYNAGDSLEFVAVEKDNGEIKKIILHEIELIDVDIKWDLPNQRLLNILDGPHKIHFNIIDSYNTLNSNDKVIINLPNNTDVQFKNTFNDSQTIINSKTLEVILDRGQSQKGEYFILDNVSTTNKSIDISFTIDSKNWGKTIKRSMNIGHPVIIIDESRSIILNRSLNPLPPIQIVGNNFLKKDDELHFKLIDNNDNIIKINNSTNYDRIDESQSKIIIYYESDTVYNISSEPISDYSITFASLEIKLLSEINKVFSRQDSILYAVTPKLLFNNPREYPYWVGNDEDSPDEVQILLDLRDNRANLYNEKSEISINIPKQAGCKWGNIGNKIQLKNDDRTIILELDTEKYPDLNNLGSMVELGIFSIVPSTVKPIEPFMFKYQLSGMDYISDNNPSQYYYPEIDIKSIQGLINNDEEVQQIYVPIGTNYEINITNFIISDNTLNPLFEIGDTCIISFDTDGFYWSDTGIYPSGIKLLSENKENENYVFVITEAINSINIKDIIIKYEGTDQPVNSISNIICDLKKSTGVDHQFYLKQTIHHTELVVDINPKDIIWTRDDHRLPELTLQGPAINKDNEIIIILNSNSEADANISWDKARKKGGNGISESRISGNKLFLSLANLGSEKKVIVPEWGINNILSHESDISLNISVDGGRNYQDPIIGIHNASLSEIYISRLRKILSVRSPQYIGMIKIKGNDDFPSILESDRLIITLTSDISPITGLQDEELQACINDIPIIKKAESKQLSEKQIQYSFQFAQSINESEMLEIDNLKIFPEWEGVSTSITLNYAIGNIRNWSEINLSIPFKDTLYVFGTQLLASDKKMIYDLSKGEEYYKLPILTILDDSDNPLIQSGDRLFITIEDPGRRIHFKEPDFEFSTNRLFNIEHESDKITFIFKSKLSDSLNIPLTIMRPIDNEPMTFSSIKGEFSLRSGEKIKFHWPVEIAFSNGTPSYKLANNKDFIINAGRQLIPDLLLMEDSLQANTDKGDFITLIIPYDFNAKWDKTITKIASTNILDRNVLYSSEGDTARIRIKKNAELNEEFKIIGLGFDHIVGEISDGYSPLEIILDNNFHKPELKAMANSGQIRTGMVDIILGSEEYITSDDHIINNLEIEFQQITHPELFFDELWLELVKLDDFNQPVGKWKKGNKYPHEWYENNYKIKKIKKLQKRLVLELKNKGEPLNDIIRLEGIQLKEPQPSKNNNTSSYGINILYKSNPDSVLAKSNEILSVQYDKVGGCFCTELETVVLGVDGLKPIEGEYDLMIDSIKIAGESYDPDKILSIEYDENKLWIAKKKGKFDPNVLIEVTMGYAINSQSKRLCSYVQTECDDCEGGKHYAQHCVDNPNSNPSRIKRKNTDKKSQNFSSVDIDRKSLKVEDGYIYFSTIFKPRAPQCIDNEERFKRTKRKLETVFKDSLKRDKHMTLDYWDNEINLITAKNNNCQEPPYRSNSKVIYYLLALNHYTNRDMKNACDHYKKATCELECIGDFMELPDCMDKGPDRIAAELIKNMSQNTHKINSYIEDLDNKYSYSKKFLEDLKDAQYTLLELESIDGWKSALKKNEKFHMLNVDLAMLLIDIKYLENMYIYKKGHKKYGQLKKTLPKGIRKGKKYKDWRNSRIEKYTTLIENQRDTTNQLQMYSSKKREKLHTEVINIKFEKNKDIPFEILPKIYNMAEYSNLDEKHVSDFKNVVEFNKRGIYKIDLDIEKDKKYAYKLATTFTSILLILLII